MSERTTIGGTVYEAIGSSSSNLLLKCNGTARIQWGGKLIDLIKNGKIASGDSQELIFIIGDESEMKSDGIYILTTEESDQLLVFKDGNKYNFTNTDLYISASKEQNLTVEQKKQALDNIGIYYDTLTEVQSAGIKNGIVYVTENKTLYTIKDGVIEEFEAKLKTVTVEKESDDNGEVINSAVKIVLSILDEEYLILADQRITANYSIHVKNSAQIGSESADKTQGYRLYIEGNTSYLDVDEINVRNGIKVTQYTSITFEEFIVLVNTESLEPHWWYLITDYQNPWKLPIYNEQLNRPILVRALDNKTLYKKGYLFKNHNIEIEYDPTYKIEINQEKTTNGQTTTEVITSRGLITWMKDKSNNNQANFDFLDYYDLNGNELATLHYPTDDTEQGKSIFPKYSHDNTLIVYDLKGTVIKDKVIDNTNVTIVDFKFDDSSDSTMVMYNNYLECRGLILAINCTQFYDNILKNAIKIEIENDFYKNEFLTIYSTPDGSNVNTSFDSISDNNLYTNTIFSSLTENVKCKEFRHSSLQNTAINCVFGNIENSIFTQELENVNINLIKSSPSYQNSFNTIKNSTIKEITNGALFYGEIIDSTIEIVDSEITIHSNINKSTINKISNNVTLLGEINNSYIDVISNNTSLQTNLIESCNIKSIKNSTLSGRLENSTFKNVDSTTIEDSISNSVFQDLYNCTLKASFDNVKFNTLSGCVFDYGTIENVASFYNLDTITFNRTTHILLYNTSKRKEIYINDGVIQVVCIPDSIFYRGMIIMHSGQEKIPLGWAVCDGGTYEFEGVTSTTPNLINRFIKAVATAEEVKETLNENLNQQNEFTLKEENLPKHSHPHKAHTHEHTEITGSISNSGDLSVSGTGYTYSHTMEAVQSVSGPEDVPITSSKGDSGEYYESTTYTYTGGNHTHDLTISGGQIQESPSIEDDKTWENKSFKLEPNYYSLIFIMKL